MGPSQVERKQWLEAKAGGKTRFLGRGVVGSLVNGLAVLLGLALLDRSHTFRENISPDLVVLLMFLLGGYLTALWQWHDFEERFPENRLPPWE